MICSDYNDKNLQIDLKNNFINFYQEIFKFFISLSIFVFGLASSFIFVAVCIVNPLVKKHLPFIEIYDNLEKESKLEMEFLETNYDAYEDLSMNNLGETYNNEYFEMLTPKGIVYMAYDRELKLFNYYSDKKEIPNTYLDCVARNFVINYDCKSIFIDLNEEMKRVYEIKNTVNECKKKEDKIINKIQNINVYAKFKNTISEKNQNKIPLIPEKCNIFKYKGKIIDYKNDILKIYDKQYDQDYIKIDYKTFKNKIE